MDLNISDSRSLNSCDWNATRFQSFVFCVSFKKNPLGTFKQHENAEFSSGFSCTYIKQMLDGEELLELDYMANIFKVDGEDILADYRYNVGS